LVVGSSERPLELYALLDGKTVAYTTLRPDDNGNQFELRAGEDELRLAELPGDTRPQRLRLDLVDGAVIWYSIEMPIW
jgi:hypothetical protein